MEPWAIPVISACIVFGLVIVGYIVFFARRAGHASPTIKKTAASWSSSVGETTKHLLRDQALDRCIILCLNFTSLFWSFEHNLIHTDRHLVYFRRALNILAIFIGLFTVGIADVIFLNWGCYPSTTPIDDYNQGLCDDSSSPIRTSPNQVDTLMSFANMSSWIWISNAVFAGSIVVSLAIHAYLSYNFKKNLQTGAEGNYTGTIDTINQHKNTFTAEQSDTLKKYIWTAFHSHVTSGTNESFAPHEIHLHRITELFFDPVAIFLGFPAIIIARSDVAIANFFNILLMPVTWALYTNWAIPRWEKTCCYYDDATSSGGAGDCNDSSSPIYHDPFRLSCKGLNTELTVILCIGLGQLALSFIFWLYSVILYNFIVMGNTKKLLTSLHQVANEKKLEVLNHHAEYPPPAYGQSDPLEIKKSV